MMPKIAEGDANKVWVIPSEITKALEGLGSSIHEIAGIPKDATPRTRVDMGPSEPQLAPSSGDSELSSANKAVKEAIAAAESAAAPSRGATPAPQAEPDPGVADAPPPSGEASPEEPPTG
jgi:hypothetical protein